MTLAGVDLNWLNWFHFLILEGGLLIILIDCMIFMSLFLDVTKLSMSTVPFFSLLFFVTQYLIVAVQPCME